MIPFWEKVLRAIVQAAHARRLIEVGVATGLMTAKVLDYCAASDAVLYAIDPQPQVDVREWRERHGERLVFHQARSLDIIGDIHDVDFVLIDGDHNWFTVHHELKLIEETALNGGVLPPVIALHDVDWPYGRRDMYYDPESIPAAHRHPYRKLGLVPGEDEPVDGGANGEFNNAVTENSPHNGVRTAIEDFASQSQLDWKLSYVPGFHGLGIAVTTDRLASNEQLRAAIESVETSRFLDDWARELELARVEASRQTVRLQEVLADAERRLAGVPDLQLRISELERDLADARRDAESTREQARLLDQRVTMGDQVLADVFNSLSWRLTQPLRAAKHSVGRLRVPRGR